MLHRQEVLLLRTRRYLLLDILCLSSHPTLQEALLPGTTMRIRVRQHMGRTVCLMVLVPLQERRHLEQAIGTARGKEVTGRVRARHCWTKLGPWMRCRGWVH